jgi:ribulose-5-phosphate 4-epimerase/fuculose-1-phosphate aldolase
VIDEGYTKFEVDWTRSATLDLPQLDELIRWRRPLYRAGLVGLYEDLGISFGNISARVDTNRFVISGTQTGRLSDPGRRYYALVTGADIDANRISCRGPVQASSESMTHAMIYSLDRSIDAVVHVHSDELWAQLIDRLPTTDAAAAFGTPEIAREFARLYAATDFRECGLAVMAGHEAGLVSIGANVEEAASRVLGLLGEKPG